jgi:hypothetical protein
MSLTNSALRHENVWGSECIDPRIIDLGTIWLSCELHAPASLLSGKELPVSNG